MEANRIHMKDQKLRGTSGIGAWMFIAVMFAVGFGAMLARSARADTAQCSITSAIEDNLMSEEMAEFIARHPGEYTEEDLN